MSKISQTLIKLEKHEFSWWGRLSTFKMIHLPQVLYVFRCLPIPIPLSFFKTLQSILSKFIWKGKKSRCAHHKLIRHRMWGGVGYIDFQDYFYSSVLTQLKEWFQSSPTTTWGLIESSYCVHTPTKLWLFGAQIGFKIPLHLPPTMRISISTWLKFLKSTENSVPRVRIVIPFSILWLVLDQVSLDQWESQCIVLIQDLYCGNEIKSFESIKSEYSIPQICHIQYKKIKRYLNNLKSNDLYICAYTWNFFNISSVENKRYFTLLQHTTGEEGLFVSNIFIKF